MDSPLNRPFPLSIVLKRGIFESASESASGAASAVALGFDVAALGAGFVTRITAAGRLDSSPVSVRTTLLFIHFRGGSPGSTFALVV